MIRRNVLAVVCLFAALLSKVTTDSTPQKLLLSVYYESLCPDSKLFILRQLQPAVELLHEHLRLQLVPFGKSQSINNGYGGYQCQHGPGECLGNVVQDCALSFMNELSDKEKLAYVACEMQTNAGSMGRLECVQGANLPLPLIQNCVLHEKGIALQLNSEYLTKKLSPSFVPTITVNGIFDQNIQDSAQTNLIETLCSLLKETPPCANYYNTEALNDVIYTNFYNMHAIPSRTNQ